MDLAKKKSTTNGATIVKKQQQEIQTESCIQWRKCTWCNKTKWLGISKETKRITVRVMPCVLNVFLS